MTLVHHRHLRQRGVGGPSLRTSRGGDGQGRAVREHAGRRNRRRGAGR